MVVKILGCVSHLQREHSERVREVHEEALVEEHHEQGGGSVQDRGECAELRTVKRATIRSGCRDADNGQRRLV